jgi:WD40 repeat protein
MLLFDGKHRSVTGLAFSPDGATLAAGSSSRVELWNVAAATVSGMSMGIWGVPPDNVRFDPSGRWLLVGFGLQRGLRIVDVRTWEVEQVGTFDVNSLAVSPTGQVLVGGSRIGAFEITKKGLSARKWAKALNGSQLAGLDFYPDGKQFATVEWKYSPGAATGGYVKRVRVRAAEDGRVKQEAECDSARAAQVRVSQVRVSPDGQWVAFPSAKFLIVHHGVELTRSVKVPNPSKKPITGLAFHPSGRYLAATCSDATVRLHDRDADWAVTRAFDWKIGGLKSVAFHPEGTLGAAGGEKGRIVVWDVDV